MPPPDLEDRFLPPENWTENYFEHPETGHKIRYGHASAENAKACVILLGGLSEFAEKYFETMRDLNARGLSVWTMDWAYQGLSNRNPKNPHKRCSDGYDADLSDLHFFTETIVPKEKPIILLAHSMGGHIGLRYLAEHPDNFKATAFSAPMLGIRDIRIYGRTIKLLLKILLPLHTSYVPGGKDWHETMRKSDGNDVFSSDPARDGLHNLWCLHTPALQVGNPTLRWLYESVKSLDILNAPETLRKIKIPVLLTTAGDEKIVDNKAIKAASDYIEKSIYLEIEGAKHEILMEKDEYRIQFFKAFDTLLKQANIPV